MDTCQGCTYLYQVFPPVPGEWFGCSHPEAEEVHYHQIEDMPDGCPLEEDKQ